MFQILIEQSFNDKKSCAHEIEITGTFLKNLI